MSVEKRLMAWADWIIEASGPVLDPEHGYSLGDSIAGQPSNFAGTGGQERALTARGKQTQSYRDEAPGEPPDGWWTTSDALYALRRHQMPRDLKCGERSWSVLMAKYLGWVPRRRDRIRRDEHGVHIVRERMPQGASESENAYHERLRQRLLLSRTAFYARLARGHEFVAGYIDAAEKRKRA